MKTIQGFVVAFFALVVALFALPTSAQSTFVPIQIYDHAQKAVYNNPSEFIELSAQLHLVREGAPVPNGNMANEHGHIEVKCPVKGYTSGESLHCTFRVRTFDLEGTADGIFGELLENVKWDATGTDTPPDMTHAGMGLGEYHGSFDVNPLIEAGSFTPGPHGLFTARVALQFRVSRVGTTDAYGMQGRAEIWVPFFSNRDPSAPLIVQRGENRVIYESQADVASEGVPGVGWANTRLGTMVTELYSDPPLAPITADYPIVVAFYNYSADTSLPCGSAEFRLDMDFHNGIPGTVIDSEPCFNSPSGIVKTFHLNPSMGVGAHRAWFSWTQVDPDSHQQATVIQVIAFTVASGGPTTCEIAGATNLHGPLPCVFPPTDPVVTWDPIAVGFQRKLIDGVPQNVFRFCTGLGACFTWPVTPIPQ